MRHRGGLLSLLLLCSCSALAATQAQVSQGLKIIVIDGDEAANIVQEKIAAEPVVEVRDGDDRRIAGAVVRFLIRRTAVGNRIPAIFANGRAEVRALTDETGRATTSVLTPLEPGRFEIEIQVSHQGRNATATIRHTNFSTTTQARLAGREPGQSSGSTAGQTGTASGGTAPAAAGAAGGATAATAGGSALTKLAVGGLVLGGAAGGAYYALAQKDRDSSAGRVGAVTASARSGIQAATAFTFSAQVTDFDAGSLTYHWEFGDGVASSEPEPTHVYQSAGNYTVGVTVADSRQSAQSETTVIVHTLSGSWVGRAEGVAGVYTLQLSQSGNVVGGVSSLPSRDGPEFFQCPVNGSARSGTPALVLIAPPCRHPEGGVLEPGEYRLDLSVDGQALTGTSAGSVSGNIRQITFRR